MFAPKFTIRPDLLRLVSQASELKAWIQQSLIDVPWLPALQQETTLRLAHSSTAIEGNPLSLREVKAVAEGQTLPISPKAGQEVLNQIRALKWVARRRAGEEITEAKLLHLHRLITEKLLPASLCGHYKTRPNRIVNSRGMTVYTPPGPEKVRPMTRDLLTWLHQPQAKSLHPILSSAIAHYQLVSIHPFADGNGRTTRALAIWILYTRGFDTNHICALDEYFWEDRQRYYEKLTQTRELEEDLTLWLEYVAEGVVRTLQQTRERIHSLSLSSQEKKIALTPRQEQLLRLLRDQGRVRAPQIESELKLTRARVSQIMQPLVKAGLVIREGQTRATSYRLKQ